VPARSSPSLTSTRVPTTLSSRIAYILFHKSGRRSQLFVRNLYSASTFCAENLFMIAFAAWLYSYKTHDSWMLLISPIYLFFSRKLFADITSTLRIYDFPSLEYSALPHVGRDFMPTNQSLSTSWIQTNTTVYHSQIADSITPSIRPRDVLSLSSISALPSRQGLDAPKSQPISPHVIDPTNGTSPFTPTHKLTTASASELPSTCNTFHSSPVLFVKAYPESAMNTKAR